MFTHPLRTNADFRNYSSTPINTKLAEQPTSHKATGGDSAYVSMDTSLVSSQESSLASHPAQHEGVQLQTRLMPISVGKLNDLPEKHATIQKIKSAPVTQLTEFSGPTFNRCLSMTGATTNAETPTEVSQQVCSQTNLSTTGSVNTYRTNADPNYKPCERRTQNARSFNEDDYLWVEDSSGQMVMTNALKTPKNASISSPSQK